MADIEQLRSLRERVIAATGADRLLDADVMAGIVGGRVPKWMREGHPGCYWHQCPMRAAPITASLDAAVALVERCLPGWSYTLDARTHVGFKIRCRLYPPDVVAHGNPDWEGFAATAANAILAALLSALIARAEEQTP